MRRVRFGRTNLKISAVSLGTWAFGGPQMVDGQPVGWFGSRDSRVLETLARAYELGINHWDTADVYGGGHAERLIGQVWDQIARREILLATKVGYHVGPHGHGYHPQQIRQQLETSLRNLRTETIDLYYFHHCDFGPNAQYLDDALELFHRFREGGKIRFIGLADRKPETILRYVERIRPDVVQFPRNVIEDDYGESGLRTWIEKNDAAVAFSSPLKHGLLLGKFEGPVTFGAGDHRNKVREFRDFGLISRLRSCRREMAKRFAGRPDSALFGLVGSLLSDAPSGCVLLGQHRPEQVEDAAAAGDPLEEGDSQWVRRLYRENGRPTRASWKSYQPTI